MHAGQKLAYTAELWLAILDRLDNKTLLIAQRVNQASRHLIKTTETLQTRLFFNNVQNPNGDIRIFINNLIFPENWDKISSKSAGAWLLPANFFRPRDDLNSNLPLQERKYFHTIRYPQGSWREMRVLRGAVETVQIELFWRSSNSHKPIHIADSSVDGSATLGYMLDEVMGNLVRGDVLAVIEDHSKRVANGSFALDSDELHRRWLESVFESASELLDESDRACLRKEDDRCRAQVMMALHRRRFKG